MPATPRCLTPMLGVRDLKKTIEFYQSALGFDVTNTFERDGRIVWAEFTPVRRWLVSDRPVLMCNEVPAARIPADADDRRSKKNVVLYFYPTDIVHLHAEMRRKGFAAGDLRVTIYGMKEFELEDPDGYQLWFGQPTDEPPSVRE